MKAWLRRYLVVNLAASVWLAGSLKAQDLSEITAATRELRQTLRDVDKRVSELEKLLNREAGERKKQRRVASNSTAVPASKETTVRMGPAAELTAGQDSYRRARVEEAAQQYEKAIELYTQAVRLDPKNDLAFLHRGMADLHVGRLDQALADANESLAIQPNSAQAYWFRSSVYFSTKAYEPALADLKEATLRDPKNPDYVVAQAAVEEERGNLKEAADLYEKASTLHPGSIEILIKSARAFRLTNEVPRAVAQCGRAIEMAPNSADGYVCRAESFLRNGALLNAVDDLNQAFHLQPTLPEVAKLLPVVREMIQVNEDVTKIKAAQKSNTPQAAEAVANPPGAAFAPLEALTSAVPHPSTPMPSTPMPSTPMPLPATLAGAAPSNLAPLNQAPLNQTSSSHPKAPRPVAQERPPATTEGSQTSDQALREGRKSVEKGLFQAAIVSFGRAIELDPSSAVAYNSRGYAYLRTRQYELAIRDFSAAIGINANYANAYWNRSVARRLSGDVPGSRKDVGLATRLGYPTNIATLGRPPQHP
jgi:tetratricopeptide (TPR) repeat protein